MALTATPHNFEIALSDVDRGVYEALELRPARHPSETLRYLLTRTLAYCFSYEEGIGWSKGGLSSAEEPPLSIRDATGKLVAWIDVGAPAADRLHKASKAAERVEVYTSAPLALLRREAATRAIHKLESIAVWRFEPSFLDALEPFVERRVKLEVLRNGGLVYVTVGGKTVEGAVTRESLVG